MFIDARNEGHLINRRTRELSADDIHKIAATYHNWRNRRRGVPLRCPSDYIDIKGFCCSANIERVRELDYVLTPGRYVGIKDEVDDGIPFEEKIKQLTTELAGQMEEEVKLNKAIKKNLEGLGYGF